MSQRLDEAVELLVCDDGSTDGTREILAGYGARLKHVPRPEGAYRPGRTLNRLVAAAQGEYLVFNNADAVPQDDTYLAELLKPLRENRAEVTFGNQLPRPDAAALVRKDSERAFGDGRVSRHWPRFFSLASSAARRQAFVEHPFNETLCYSEDIEWANRRPIRRVYVPTARVEHSHDYTDAQLRRRFYGEGYADVQIFGDEPPSGLKTVLAAGRETVRDLLYLARRPADWREMPSAFHRRLIQRLSYREGAVDAAAGRAPRTVSTDKPSADVLFVGAFVGFAGGIERYAFAAAEVLRREGKTVDYVGAQPSREAERFASVFGRVLADAPTAGYGRVVIHKLPAYPVLKRLVRAYGDRLEIVVHDHDVYCPRRHYYTPFGRCNCRRTCAFPRCLLCAAVTHPRNWPSLLRRRPFATLRLLRGQRATVLSEFMRGNLVRNGFAAERVAVIPPPVAPAAHPHPARPPDAPLRMLFLGQLIAGKGCDLLLEAARRLKRPYRLTVAGDGPDRARLEAQAATLANGEVIFAGWVSDSERLWDEADVLAFPSRWQEPYGLVGAEAQVHGVPVVAFDVGGVRSWAGKDCRLVPAGDVAGFAQALEEVS